MGLLDDLMGNQQKQQEYQNFANQYDQGPAMQSVPDQEVMNRYQQVATQLPPDQYERAATQAFMRMSPEERTQFGQYVQQQTVQQGYATPAMQQLSPQQYQDPGALAQMATQLHQQQPGLLGQLLGGGIGGGNGGSGSMLSNPIAKAALAGITAMAVKEVMAKH
jgi:hypothetical protein